MRTLLLLLFAFAIIGSNYGQETILEKRHQEDEHVDFPRFRVGFSPSAFLNWLPRIQANADVGLLGGRMNMGVDVGYIFSGREIIISRGLGSSVGNSKGISSRLSLDYSLVRKTDYSFYIGSAYLVRSTSEKHNEWLNFPNEGYAKFGLRKETVLLHGASFHMGGIVKLDKRVYFETSVNAGSGSLLGNSFFDGDKIENRSVDRNIPIFFYYINFSYAL